MAHKLLTLILCEYSSNVYLDIKMYLSEDILTKLPLYIPQWYGVSPCRCYRTKLVKGVVKSTWSESKGNMIYFPRRSGPCNYKHFYGLVPLRFSL